MRKYTIKNLTDTKKLAEQLASSFKGGEVLGLVGDLGAGKTTFVQFLAQVLGVKDTVNSPTFNIIKSYKILNPKSKIKNLIHIDAYRLNSPEELTALGVEEHFNDEKTVTIIEWADKVMETLPKNAIKINIKLDKNTRTFKIS
ncbi:MAG: tRNA (adenosine(37)-N6)-threonylcarbamoyltransferase complex ATPase subunit type 1 TsaE [bacterium]|nr:tRNA (adenosine(37)-N6)-threonylcarbamoyltransferase complex ATPase subunit type 1 TsaE [bacterium]